LPVLVTQGPDPSASVGTVAAAAAVGGVDVPEDALGVDVGAAADAAGVAVAGVLVEAAGVAGAGAEAAGVDVAAGGLVEAAVVAGVEVADEGVAETEALDVLDEPAGGAEGSAAAVPAGVEALPEVPAICPSRL
jgi:hypothetical protein